MIPVPTHGSVTRLAHSKSDMPSAIAPSRGSSGTPRMRSREVAAMIGIWLFYVQHQFENAYWEPRNRWDFHAAAIQGSSFYDLPAVVHWLTGNIGFHHIHHFASRIPNYRLRACHEASPVFRQAPRLTFRESLRCTRLALWDPELRKLVPFN